MSEPTYIAWDVEGKKVVIGNALIEDAKVTFPTDSQIAIEGNMTGTETFNRKWRNPPQKLLDKFEDVKTDITRWRKKEYKYLHGIHTHKERKKVNLVYCGNWVLVTKL